jgi:hypothetical protein
VSGRFYIWQGKMMNATLYYMYVSVHSQSTNMNENHKMHKLEKKGTANSVV